MVEYALFGGLTPDHDFFLHQAPYNHLCFSRTMNLVFKLE